MPMPPVMYPAFRVSSDAATRMTPTTAVGIPNASETTPMVCVLRDPASTRSFVSPLGGSTNESDGVTVGPATRYVASAGTRIVHGATHTGSHAYATP